MKNRTQVIAYMVLASTMFGSDMPARDNGKIQIITDKEVNEIEDMLEEARKIASPIGIVCPNPGTTVPTRIQKARERKIKKLSSEFIALYGETNDGNYMGQLSLFLKAQALKRELNKSKVETEGIARQ